MVVNGAAGKVHCLAVGGEGAGSILIFAVYVGLYLFYLLPFAFLVALCHKQVGRLLSCYSAQVVALCLFTCRGYYYGRCVLAHVHRTKVASLSVKFLCQFYNVACGALFPLLRLTGSLQTKLCHSVVGVVGEIGLVIAYCRLVVAILYLRIGKMAVGDCIGIFVAYGILIGTGGALGVVALAIALGHFPRYYTSAGTFLRRNLGVGAFVLLGCIEIFVYCNKLVAFAYGFLAAASGNEQQKNR